jgi:hypothetical protein
MITDLDFTGDGEITKDEFSTWWLGGRKGRSGNFSKLVAAKLI